MASVAVVVSRKVEAIFGTTIPRSEDDEITLSDEIAPPVPAVERKRAYINKPKYFPRGRRKK